VKGSNLRDHRREAVLFNGLQLAEGGDFQHKLSYEALKFIYPQNCPTKHVTATFGKVLLAVRCFFFVRVCPYWSVFVR